MKPWRWLTSRTNFAVAILFILVAFKGNVLAQNYVFGRADLSTGNFPAGAIINDFNGDGKPDLAVSNFNDSTVSILLGVKNGTFGAATTYATGMSPGALIAADFNGDKKVDLAVTNENDHTVSIFLGNGDGTFQSPKAYALGYFPIGIVTADFNGDKRPDLAIVNLYDSTVSVLINNGDGTFQPQILVTVGSTPTALSSGDFNGDGKVDLITTNIGSGTVSVLLSNGDGTFTRVDSNSGLFAGSNSSEITVADFNGDGQQDAVVSSVDTFQLFFLAGDGNGSFAKAVSLPNLPQLPASYYFLTSGDFNRDGKPDLALAGIFVLLGKGDGTFGKPIASPSGGAESVFATADVNGDGLLDFAGVDSNLGTIDVMLGNGDGLFQSVRTISVASTAYGPLAGVAADFNGDGKLDLAVEESNFPNGLVAVAAGNGDGTFQRSVTSPLAMSGGTNVMIAGDFNGDNKTDLILLDNFSGGIEVLLGNGDNTFQKPVDSALTTSFIAVGDFNTDSKTDLVAVTNQGSSLTIYLSNGDGTFSPGASYSAGFEGTVTVVDVNHDGKADLVSSGPASELLVFLGKGDGTFGSPISGPTAYYSQALVAGDFDGDGKVDVAGGTSAGMAFLKGNGDGTFQAPVYSNPTYPFNGGLVEADISGDGKPDLISYPPQTTTLGGGAVAMVGNGDGTFGTLISLGATGIAAGWPSGDFNSDGVADLAMPNQDLSGSPATVVTLYLSAPVVNLFPNTLSFGAVTVGKTSKPQRLTLTNTGNAPLALSGITVSGDFLLSNRCGSSLAIGRSCAIQVTFKPSVKGLRTGTLNLSDDAAGSPQRARLSGTGN